MRKLSVEVSSSILNYEEGQDDVRRVKEALRAEFKEQITTDELVVKVNGEEL